MGRSRPYHYRDNLDYPWMDNSLEYLEDPHPWKMPLHRFHHLYRYPSKVPLTPLEAYQKKRSKTSQFPIQVVLKEPFEVYAELSDEHPFPTKISIYKKKELDEEIKYLKDQLGDLVSLPGKIKNWRRLVINKKPKTKAQYRNTIYSLWRLKIAKIAVEELKKDVKASLAEVLALYQTEGDLNIPLSLLAVHLEIEPNGLHFISRGKVVYYVPLGHASENYGSPHQTFHVEKNDLEKLFYQGKFQKEVESTLKSRQFILDNANMEIVHNATPLLTLQNAKENTLQMYLLSLIGLDIYSWGTWPIYGFYDRDRKRFFCYHYARYRIKAGSNRSFDVIHTEAKETYDRMTKVTQDEFVAGDLTTDSIICTLYDHKKKGGQHHFMPVDPIDFTSNIIKEGLITFLALKRDGLIFGGERFDITINGRKKAGLPSAVAYMRYNMGEINFTLILMETLYKLIHRRSNARSPSYLWKIKDKLKEFHKDSNDAIWEIVTDRPEFLKEKDVTSGKIIRSAISYDSRDSEKYTLGNPGKNEKETIKELREKGKLATVIPLIDAMTTKELWDDYQKAIFSSYILNSKRWYCKYLKKYQSRFFIYYKNYKRHLPNE